jgi:hypothetical protein
MEGDTLYSIAALESALLAFSLCPPPPLPSPPIYQTSATIANYGHAYSGYFIAYFDKGEIYPKRDSLDKRVF